MNLNKIYFYLTFAALLLSCISCSSDTVSVSLKISGQGYLIIPAKYGSSQCETNLLPLVSFCSNFITQSSEESDFCGVTFIGENYYVGGKQYAAQFQLGNAQAKLNFTNPYKQSSSYLKNALCFGKKDSSNQDNVVEELFQQGFIKEQRFYVQVNSTNATQGVIGSIDIGSPNLSLIKKGSQLVYLKHYGTIYATPLDRFLYYGDAYLDQGSGVGVGFDLQSPYTQIGIASINFIVKQLQEQSIGYEYHFDTTNKDYTFNVDSIEKLKNISLNVITYNESQFKITIKPQDYTRKLQNGKYQVLLYPLTQSTFISLGYSVLQSYYIGFDLATQTYLISEKSQINTTDQF
ncbi:hypothetical protein ABPG72_011038 [Tetrahymena utriculariae]